MNIWIPFFSALAGGLLVLSGQTIDWWRKQRQETKNSLREIYAYCRKLEALMKNNYRELAEEKIILTLSLFCEPDWTVFKPIEGKFGVLIAIVRGKSPF